MEFKLEKHKILFNLTSVSIYNIFPQSNRVLHWLISVRLWSQSKVLNAKFHHSIVGGFMASLFSSATVHNKLHPTLNPVQRLLSQNGALIAASAHFSVSYKAVHLMLKVRQIPNTHIHIVYTLACAFIHFSLPCTMYVLRSGFFWKRPLQWMSHVSLYLQILIKFILKLQRIFCQVMLVLLCMSSCQPPISSSFAVQECSCRGLVNQGWRKLLFGSRLGQQSPVSQPLPLSCRWWCTAEERRKGLSFMSELTFTVVTIETGWSDRFFHWLSDWYL